MKPLSEETEYVTMSKDLFKLFIGISFKGGLIHQLRHETKTTDLSHDQAEQEMIYSVMGQVDKLMA